MNFSIKEFLNKNKTIIFSNQKYDYKNAIKIAIQPLIDANFCNIDYYNSIIESTEKYGPYYILCPNVAMPHGEIGKGVNKNAVSIAIFEEPVIFPGDIEIRILMVICAKDANIHTSVALPQIAALFENQDNIDALINSSTIADVIDIINNADLTKYLK